MDMKQKFKIILISDDNTETKLWSGKCTYEELNEKLHDAIRVQLEKYNVDSKGCKLRAYDDMGRVVAQETFHG